MAQLTTEEFVIETTPAVAERTYPLTGVDGNALIEESEAAAFRPILDSYLVGGWRVVADLTERDAIPENKRKIGLRARVVSEAKTFELVGGIENTDWIEVSEGGGGGGFEFTTEQLKIPIDWATGYDGPAEGEVLFHNQAEVDAYLTSKGATAFKYPTKVWDNALPTLINDSIRFWVAAGIHRPENPLPADATAAWDFGRKSKPHIFGEFGSIQIYQGPVYDLYNTWESLLGDLSVVSYVNTSPDGGVTPPSITVSGTPFGADNSLVGYFVLTNAQLNLPKPIVGNTADTLYLANQVGSAPSTIRVCSPGVIFRNSYDDVNPVHTNRVFDFGGNPPPGPYIAYFDSIRIDQMGRATGIYVNNSKLEMWGCLFDMARQNDDFGITQIGQAIQETYSSGRDGVIGGQLWSTNFRGMSYAAVPISDYGSWGPIYFQGIQSQDLRCQMTLLWGVMGGFKTWFMDWKKGSMYLNSFRFVDCWTGGSALLTLTDFVLRFTTSQQCLSGFVRCQYMGFSFSNCVIEGNTNPYHHLLFDSNGSTSYPLLRFLNDNKMINGPLRLKQGLNPNNGILMQIAGPRNDLSFPITADLAAANGNIQLCAKEYGSGPPNVREFTWSELADLRSALTQPAGSLVGVVTVERVETGATIGNAASIRYTASGTTLEFLDHGDSGYGTPVNVANGGHFTLRSANGKAVTVYVEPSGLPVGDDTQPFEVTRGFFYNPWNQCRVAVRYGTY